jgi:hypothetical protein
MPARDPGEGSPPEGHPDRLRWNARYAGGFVPSFAPHQLAVRALAMDLPDGPAGEARRRGLDHLVTPVQADLAEWRPRPGSYALVLCTGFWDRDVFATAAAAVAPGGLLGWEAFTAEARLTRPDLPPDWCLAPGEPASLLPAGFTVLDQQDLPDGSGHARRRMLARRQ